MRLPTKLPHPLAGKWVVRRVKTVFRARMEFTRVNYMQLLPPLDSHPPLYQVTHTLPLILTYITVQIPTTPLLKSTLCVTVDDIRGIGFHLPHFDLLLTVLPNRYGPGVDFDYAFRKYAGQQYHTQSDGALTADCSQYIQEMLTTIEGEFDCCKRHASFHSNRIRIEKWDSVVGIY